MPAISARRVQLRRFVPQDIDPLDVGAISELFDDLDARDISTREGLEEWILDWEELSAVLSEAYAEAYVDMTSDTANPDYEQRYVQVVEQVIPVSEQRSFALKQRLLQSAALEELGEGYSVYIRNVRAEVEIFREENIPLLTEEKKLDQQFEKISGAQKAEFRGEVYTLPQIMRFLEEPDRDTRREAWLARAGAKLADAEKLDELFDRMYAVRQQIARNAGFGNYREYKWIEQKRFDYTPEDCLAFHEAIEKYVVPVVAEDDERRKRKLGLDTLRPWDLLVDPEGSEPPRPFETAGRLQEGAKRIMERVDPELGGYFRAMIEERLLDLENRPGKAPGGYMISFPDKRVPFIFMNAVGTKRDVDTMLHEGGHAFHYFLARRQPLFSYHHTGLEFAEVASTSMEYLTRPYLSEFYSEGEMRRIRDEQIREALRFFPFMAMIDAFQHWIYTGDGSQANPKSKTQVQKSDKWAELEERFRPGLDWSGLEEYRNIGWQYPHIFSVPFYYVEYGIAQLAAFRIWLNSLENEREAVQAYKRALALGGSRPLPELFEAAGAEFGLNDRIVASTVEGVLAQLSAAD